MALPAPHLDDRRFQQLVDDAKRFVQQRCPEWTDHNVSDPGVTLIEAFAHMTDQLLYRLNRVPDKSYLAFLDLVGVTLFPPTPAGTRQTFWLSAPQSAPVVIHEGTEVATDRTENEEARVFATTADLTVRPCAFTHLLTQAEGGRPAEHTDHALHGQDVPCFGTDPSPAPGDSMLIGLSDAVPHCAVVLRLDSSVEGVGVDPRQPPLRWEAYDGSAWQPCEVDEDSTGGLNRPGDVVLHVPGGHAPAAIAGRRAGWLRCRVVAAEPGQPFYSASPTVRGAEAFTIGGTTEVLHAETVDGETIGTSEGTPGQRFAVSRPPVLSAAGPFVVETSDGGGWQEWSRVETFGASSPDDRHIRLDPTTGEVAFGPAVRERDGSLRRYGAAPPKGARVRVRRYRTGGGRGGNVARGTLTVLRTSIPYVSRVENREAASGGVDGESVEGAKLRAPLQLRAQDRAVTAADYELLARQAAPSAARIRCVPAGDGAEAGGVRVLVVPEVVADSGHRLRFEQLVPPDEMLAAITGHLDARRPVGARLLVQPPSYQGVTVAARIVAVPGAPAGQVRERALDALYRHLNPVTGGPGGDGWPFGRPVQTGEAHAVLQNVPGVELVEDVRIFSANPLTGERDDVGDRIDLERNALVFSYEHQVRVEER
ncbi:putative baseplate assembly protein [Streptomyces sp. TRM 70351]|uniref:putative baseplate assembly protein n=1 Tax=Streptomyces sp. TRM 70351 TaxID=3116552 RepID=UPI002E7C4776|nr:putative baseplate assembly protein [Streptomyces sp. TRM 70351]MEE1927542.1 putative baseplate assembly protein [Streptomyces sp. TRM 70351]